MRLRIAICLAHFHPTVGGSERQMQRLAERWTNWGHRVFVLTRGVRGLPRHDMIGDVPIHRVIQTLAVGPLFGASFIASLTAQLLARRRQFDAMVAGQLPWEAVATGIAARLLRKPAIAFAASNGPQGDVRQLQSATGSGLLCSQVRHNARFIALSAEGEKELHELGCRDGQVLRSTNGVDLALYQPGGEAPPDRDRTVLYLARLSPAKNPELLLRAWRTINDSGRYRLLVAGDGPLSDELHRLADDLFLQNVEFLAHVSDVPAVHRRASVYVLPSPSEGCSNALVEAMASGLCPVVTRVPGNIDVVRHEENGLLFDHDNEWQLADAVSRVLLDEPLRGRLAAAARQHIVEHHDLDKIARDVLDVLTRLVDSGVT